jgi:hypothetical protein
MDTGTTAWLRYRGGTSTLDAAAAVSVPGEAVA